MVKEDSDAGMPFYRRLVLDFCFPNGDEHADQLRDEPEPKTPEPGGDRTNGLGKSEG